MNRKAAKHNYVEQNRGVWSLLAADYAIDGERAWAAPEIAWGCWSVPESVVGMLPVDLVGMDVIELGCGTAYISAWLARMGANPVGVDITAEQLDTARMLQEKHNLYFPLHLGNAEETPFADESVDFVVSEYGASIWCDPYKWIPEAHRLLRRGGRLGFLCNSPLSTICSPFEPELPVGAELVRDMFGMHTIDWGNEGYNFHIPHGEMIALLRSCGFAIEKLVELQIPEGSSTRHPYVPYQWARRWPAEDVWVAIKS